ncbi:MAG: MFS transporter [Anaerolineales bacterium]
MDYSKIARNITLTLLVAQSLGSVAISVTATINTIVGAELSGNPSLAGLPGAVAQIGSGLAAFAIGATMNRTGRRVGLGAGIALGVLGCVIATLSIIAGNFIFFLGGLALFGVARAAMQMGRFAAAEVHHPESRGRAVSYVIFGGVFGSVLGPQLVGPSGQLALRANIEELAGSYIVALLAFGLATAIILTFLRPDPRDVGRAIARIYPEIITHQAPARTVLAILRTPTAFLAVVTMVFGQVIMVGLMGITSLYMKGYSYKLSAISLVFSSHTLGMFAFSALTGKLVDSWGRGPVILAGAGMLFASCALAPISSDLVPLSLTLFLLGLGWNFSYIGGSTLLFDVLSPDERAKTQGANDLLIGLATAFASFTSGIVFAAYGYVVTGIIGALISLLLLAITSRWIIEKRQVATAKR